MIYLFLFACEAEKVTEFGVPSGGASNPDTYFDELNDDTAEEDTGASSTNIYSPTNPLFIVLQ